jgi:hypothetical protein
MSPLQIYELCNCSSLVPSPFRASGSFPRWALQIDVDQIYSWVQILQPGNRSYSNDYDSTDLPRPLVQVWHNPLALYIVLSRIGCIGNLYSTKGVPCLQTSMRASIVGIRFSLLETESTHTNRAMFHCCRSWPAASQTIRLYLPLVKVWLKTYMSERCPCVQYCFSTCV